MIADILRGRFQTYYQVRGKAGGDIHPSAQYRHFNYTTSSKAFLFSGLYAGADYWRRFLSRHYSTVPYMTDLQLLHRIAELVIQNEIRFYQLPELTENKVMRHDGKGTGYNFIKGPGALPLKNAYPLEIETLEQAYEIINSINAGNDFWYDYLDQQTLMPAQHNTEALQACKTNLNGYIAWLMVSGTMLVYSQPYVPPAPAAPEPEYLPLTEKDKPQLPAYEEPLTESIYINYQIDIDERYNVNDKLTLKHNESDYIYSIIVGRLFEFDQDWVCLEFPDPPKNGSYTLTHDPRDGSMEVYSVFKNVPYAKLAKLTPELNRPEK